VGSEVQASRSGLHCLGKAATVKADQALAIRWRMDWHRLAQRISIAARGLIGGPDILPLAAPICDRLAQPLAL